MKKIDKTLIGSNMIIIVIYVFNMYWYMRCTAHINVNDYTAFSFWTYVRESGIVSIVSNFILTLCIVGSVYRFFVSIKSGYYKNFINREGYNKYMIKEIINCYYKSFLTLPLFSICIFLIGLFLYGTDIPLSVGEGMFFTRYNLFMQNVNPIIIVLAYNVILCLFTLIIINCSLIFMKFINKFYMLIIGMYIFFTASNYIFSIFNISKINIFNCYNTTYFLEKPLENIIVNIILLMLTTFIVFKLYKSQEKLVLK